MNYACKIRPGAPICIADRHPIFRERDGLPRFKERIRLLIFEEPRLQLDVGAVVVGERLAPIKTLRVNTPGPNFLGRYLGIFGEMRSPRICSGMPDAYEVFTASMDEQ